jgi:dolichol-phosphate mannosyltransferase
MSAQNQKIAVVLPCYNSKSHVLDVITKIGPEVSLIFAVDDACPLGTGTYIGQNCRDERVVVIHNETNLGVGGTVIRGYQAALRQGADIIVKIDSDGQMDPSLLLRIVHPILEGMADYTKGNRFFNIEDVSTMPLIRIFGNAALSFLTKLSSGYWHIFDPTNGYTAIHRIALKLLPLDKLDTRFFFESDMLFYLYLKGAVVVDVPTQAKYGDEVSTLKIERIILPFFFKHARNFSKRLFYRYYLQDMNLGSLELFIGTLLLSFGVLFGITKWLSVVEAGVTASAGTVMLAGLPVLAGLQLVLGFFSFDFTAVPKVPLQTILGSRPFVSKGIEG